MAERQVQKLFKKYAAVSTTDGSFDSISDHNAQMDISEFTRFAKDFGLTEVLTIAKLKIIFNEANVADGADDRRGFLSQDEFGGAVHTCLERAKAEFARKKKEINNGVRMLEREMAAKVQSPSQSSARSPKKEAAKPEQAMQLSSSQELALNVVPDSNFQSDGVRVPVSKVRLINRALVG